MYWYASIESSAQAELFLRGCIGFEDFSDDFQNSNYIYGAVSSLRRGPVAGNPDAHLLLEDNYQFALVSSNDPDFLSDQFKKSKKKWDKALIVSNKFAPDDLRDKFFEENVWALSGDTLVHALRSASPDMSLKWTLELLDKFGHTPALTKTIQVASESVLAQAAVSGAPSVFTMCYDAHVWNALGSDVVFEFLKDYPILLSRVFCDNSSGLTQLSSGQLRLLTDYAAEYKVIDDGFQRVSKRSSYSDKFTHISVNPIQHSDLIAELVDSPLKGVSAAAKMLLSKADRDQFEPKADKKIASLLSDSELFALI